MQKTVGELSGGLKAKLALAMLEAERGNVLVLDEPTNHLDLPAREALESALKKYSGTVLFVSHDRRFTEAVADRVVLIEDGELHPFEGGYQAFLNRKKQPAKEQAEEKKPAETTGYRSREERAREAQRRNRVHAIEEELAALEQEDAALGEELAGCGRDYVRAQQITARQAQIAERTEALYEEYGTLI